MRRNLLRLVPLVATLAIMPAATAQAATTYTVNTEADNAPGVADCQGLPLDCSLRQAIVKAVDGDTVALPAGHYTVASTLGVSSDITIAGSGAPVIDGGHAVRVFSIGGSGNVNVSGVTVTGGKTSESEGGGGFEVIGTLTLTDSTVSDNDAPAGAGVSLVNFETDATARIIRSTISGNRAERLGGGIAVRSGDLALINSTVTGNSAGGALGDGLGGGIYLSGYRAAIYNATIVNNTAAGASGEGGNLYREVPSVFVSKAKVTAKAQADPDYLIKNTIVADGTAAHGANCGGDQPESQGNNLVNAAGECGTSAGKADVNGSPGVSALQNNGGPTLTRKLLPGSKAIDAGAAAGCVDDVPAAITTDQRVGVPRPIGSHCDIGAIEFAPPLAVTNQPQAVTKSGATITGDVTNVHVKAGSSYFEFGTSTAYGQKFDAGSVAAGASHDPRTQGVTGLSPGTLYNYRIVVQNDDDTSFGKDVTFITLTDPEPGPGPDPEPQPEPQPEPDPKPKPHKPTVRAARASSGCVRGKLGVRLSVHVSSTAKLRRVDVMVDGKRVKRVKRRRFSVQVNARHLKPGMHVLRVVATDSANRKTSLRRFFRRCRPPAQPAFTG
jgi:hypothetical protein